MFLGRSPLTGMGGVRRGIARSRVPQTRRDPWQEIKIRVIFLGVAALLALLVNLFQGAEPAEPTHEVGDRPSVVGR